MPLILETLPEFGSEWRAYVNSPSYREGMPYTDATKVAQYLVTTIKSAQANVDLRRFFDAIDRLVTEGSPEVRKLAIVGFLEDIQTLSLNDDVPLAIWEKWLQPATRDAWSALISLWSSKLSPSEFNDFVDSPPRRGSHG